MAKTNCIGIIGGGISGLAAGVALARRGCQVKLFEANEKLGGCCATTEIQGYTFNDGAMYIAVPMLLDKAFEKLGLNRESVLPLRQIVEAQTTRLPDGTVVSIGANRNIKVLDAQSNTQNTKMVAEINAMMDKWLPTLNFLTQELIPYPLSLYRLLFKGWRHLPKMKGTIAMELKKLFSEPAARATLSGILLYTGLTPEKTPITQILALAALFDEGFFLPEGGMGAIPEVLSEAFIANGGEIYTGTAVKEIKIKNGQVYGLNVSGYGLIEVDTAVSTVSGMLTFESLLDKTDVPKSMQRKTKKAPLSHRAMSLQLGLSNKIDVMSHSNSLLPFIEEQYKLHLASNGIPKWFNYTVPTVTMPELAPQGGSIIEMFPPIDDSWDLDCWDEKTTEIIADSAIAALSEIHEMDIIVKRIRSPKNFHDEMHLFDGALYGLSPAVAPWTYFPSKTPIKGLFLAGQTTYPGYGISAAALSGVFAAEAMLGK